MLTLRQIEVIRAIMITGTIAGAARLLNVSAPGISRLMKYTEDSIGVRLFLRRNGRYVPTPEARQVFDLLDRVYQRVEDLQYALERLDRGEEQKLAFASVPSIANVMVPRAVERLRQRYPGLELEIDILKIEEAIDYLLIGRGELVVLSSRFDHPVIDCQPLARGRLFCIVPEGHPLAARKSVSAREIVRHPLIGIDPQDPYGSIMAAIFARQQLAYDVTIRARFGSMVCSLVAAGLGIAVIDEFTVAYGRAPGIVCLDIQEPTVFDTYVAHRNDIALSAFAESFIALLRAEMDRVATGERRKLT